MKKLIPLLLLWAAPVFAACPANWLTTAPQWCQIQPSTTGYGCSNAGWNKLVYDPINDVHVLYADVQPSMSPFQNAFCEYQWQTDASTSQLWHVDSSTGGDDKAGGDIQARNEILCLGDPVTDASTVVHVQAYSGTCGAGVFRAGNPFAQHGTIWVGDEAITFDSCTGDAAHPNCEELATDVYLHILARNALPNVGSVAHAANLVNTTDAMTVILGAPAPHRWGTVSDPTGGTDAVTGKTAEAIGGFPETGHPNGNTTFISTTGRILQAGRYNESSTYPDTWYEERQRDSNGRPIAGKQWHRIPLASTGGLPGSIDGKEGAATYDPDSDAVFWWLGTGDKNRMWVMPLSSTSSCYGCAMPGGQMKWHQIGAGGNGDNPVHVSYLNNGDPGNRDAARLIYDKLNKRLLIVGGDHGAHIQMNNVAVYDPATGQVCLSDGGAAGGVNSSNCPSKFSSAIPGDTATLPAGNSTTHNYKWPLVAWDEQISRMVFFYNRDATQAANKFFLYDANLNKFIDVASLDGVGPLLPSGGNCSLPDPGQSLDYDSTHLGFVYVHSCSGTAGVSGGVWQLPEAAIEGTPPPVTYAVTVTKAGAGAGTVTSGDSTINCGSVCSYSYTSGSNVVLTATANSGSSLNGWSGANAGSCSGNTCTFNNLTVTKSVTAIFDLTAPPPATATVLSGVTVSGVQTK